MDFTSRLPAMVALLKQLVVAESPTHDKAAVNRMGAIMAREAGKLGAKIEVLPKADVGDIVIAHWGEGTDGILLIGHIDTVFPLGTLEMMPFKEEDGKIFGPGVLDMKGGLVIALSAIAALQNQGNYHLVPSR